MFKCCDITTIAMIIMALIIVYILWKIKCILEANTGQKQSAMDVMRALRPKM